MDRKPPDHEREAFAMQLKRLRERANLHQADVASALGYRAASPVNEWETKKKLPPPPHIVFAIERAVGAEPGELSRVLGYLPVDALGMPSTGVTEAIIGDQELTGEAKRALLTTYAALSSGPSSRG